jgi:serine/threonine-protein kinase RsbW
MGSAPRGAGGDGRRAERIEFALELSSDLRMIEPAVAYLAERCREYGFRGARLELNFRVAVTEVLANAILYGNRRDPRKRVRIEVFLDAARVRVRVTDEGPGFDPGTVPDPTLPVNLERPGGRGIFLVRRLMDRVEYNARGNAVLLELKREAPHARLAAGA